MAKSKPKNQTDLTLRNLRAARKLYKASEARITGLENRNMRYGNRLQRLEELMRQLVPGLGPDLYPVSPQTDDSTRTEEGRP